MFENDYVQTQVYKPPPPSPVRVSSRSQLLEALRQRTRPIVIEDQELARLFARFLGVPDLRQASGEFPRMSDAIARLYGAQIQAEWHIGRYVLPGNVQKVILKPKQERAAAA